ncbi:uncharacterized protein LOC131604361 [Vicia villosa]|uniref:uncharacterized protein LOC131604361 n=1 Tax=Vicia villosa TaxID=3911 RepID=UPI00273CE140|nr:uncharacterized protein LOC131604361 [Vicia villosa]
MTCHGKLPTKERLKRFHILNDEICSLCNLEIEIVEHLFFKCRIASDIWKGILQWLDVVHQPNGWEEELDWVLKSSRKKGWRARVLKLAFAENIYGVRQHRNDIVFGKDTSRNTINSIIDCIVYRGWQSKRISPYIASLMLYIC